MTNAESLMLNIETMNLFICFEAVIDHIISLLKLELTPGSLLWRHRYSDWLWAVEHRGQRSSSDLLRNLLTLLSNGYQGPFTREKAAGA
jgi:hypothetical protein